MIDNHYKEIYKELERTPDVIFNPSWCLDNLFIVRSKGGAIVPFRTNATQGQILRTMRPTMPGAVVGDIYLKGRQIGCTTFWLLYGLMNCLLTPNYKAGFITQSEDDAKEAFRKVKLAYTAIPEWLKRAMGWELLEEQSASYVFKHGSIFRTAVSVVGDTLDLLHVSEYGVISRKFPQKAKEIRQGSFPSVSPGGRIVIESTNREMGGEFLDIWNVSVEELTSILIDIGSRLTPDQFMAADASQNNMLHPKVYKLVNERMDGFMPHFYTWWQDAGYRLETLPPGFKLTDDEIARGEKIKALYGVDITPEQFAWYRRQVKLQNETVKQEHPDTVEDALASGGSQVFNLDKQIGIGHIKEYDEFKIWEVPNSKATYTIGCDISEGAGKDRSVIKVVKHTATGSWEVASWASALAPLERVVEKLNVAYSMYPGMVVPEMNFNGAGLMELIQISSIIPETDIYRREVMEERTKKRTRKLGWKTTKSTKPKMISRLERELRLGDLRIRDYEGIAECRTYVRAEDGSTNALLGKRDDMVIAYALAMQGAPERYLTQTPDLPKYTNSDIMSVEEPNYRLNNGLCL